MIGYACLNLTLFKKYGITPAHSCRESTLLKSPDPIKHCVELAKKNLNNTLKIFQWNEQNNIQMYRMSASMFPFATHENYKWGLDHLINEINELSKYLKSYPMRVSSHLPQFINLGSPKEDVVVKSIADLAFQADFFDRLKLDTSHKLIIHTGGVYEDREETAERFIKTYNSLDESIKKRLVVENDEKSWTIKQIMKIQKKTGMTVLIDSFHWELNHEKGSTFKKDLESALSTWKEKPKIHYSEQDPDKNAGAHSFYVKDIITSVHFDTMVEAKGKELAILPFIKV